MLAATQAAPDRDAGRGGASGGEAGGSAANGASGFRFVGMIVGLAAHSRVVSAGFGVLWSGNVDLLPQPRDPLRPRPPASTLDPQTRCRIAIDNRSESD